MGSEDPPDPPEGIPHRRIPQDPGGSHFPTSVVNPKIPQNTIMERINYIKTLNVIKEEAQKAPPGILPEHKTMDDYIGQTVINLSDTELTSSQRSALSKGLTFCPTPHMPNKAMIWTDFKEFYRRLCLKFHFHIDNGSFNNLSPEELEMIDFMANNLEEAEQPFNSIHKKFIDKSSWKPPRIHNSLEVFQRAFKNGLLKSHLKGNKRKNLTKKQFSGLRDLAKNPEIVIKKADKGSAVVIMNTSDYLREGYRQLSDNKFYQKLDHDPTIEVGHKINQKLLQMKQVGLISEKNFEHLSSDLNCKEGRFYLLPKIHKKGVPGRPICSSVNHPTSRISKLVDEHIKEYVPKTNSYIRDTQDFINKIKSLGQIPEGALLCTLDVSSLYTNIPNEEGIAAVAEKLLSDPKKTPIAQYIIDLLRLVLTNMNFEFNGEHYLQIGGTAMGTALAPNYANLFMDRFETKALAGYPIKPLVWKRFIDDVFCIWTHGVEAFKEFTKYLNSIHPSIKFTYEFSEEKIDFLDTTVKLDENRRLITTLYNKPTDTHLYLDFTSAHPKTVMDKGPYGQYLRLRRICTLDKDFESNAHKLTGYYLNRGYPFKSLKAHYKRARGFTQDQLLESTFKKTVDTPVMVTQFNPANPDIKKMVRKHWNIISNCEELNNIFKSPPLIGFRKLPNLREILTSAKIRYPNQAEKVQNQLPQVCTRLGKCTYCPKIKKVDTFTSFHTKKTYQCKNLPIKPRLTCELSNLIYMITCKQCGMQYIGETKRPFRQRMYEHTSSVKHPKEDKYTPVSRHFTQQNHSVKDMEFSIIHWLGNATKSDMTPARRSQELYYIWLLPSLVPIGINVFM